MSRRPTPEEQTAHALEEVRDAEKSGKTELSVRTHSVEVLDAVCNVETLEKLTLNLDVVDALPPAIGNLQRLTGLYITSSPLKVLPKEIGKLSRLTTLHLYLNQFESLPEEIGGWVGLRNAVLWHNQLTTLPKGIGSLRDLEELDLHGNKLVSLPPEMAGLENLTELDLDRNALASFPLELGALKKLKRLKLGTNKLTVFPEAVFGMTSLEELGLEGNEIGEIPDGIAQMKSLVELNLGKNRLQRIPDALFGLNLVVLKLDQNQIKEVPKGIGHMKQLAELRLRDNPIQAVPAEVVEKGKDAIFQHLGLTESTVVTGDLPPDAERLALIERNKDRIEKFRRESKSRSHDEDMLVRVIDFITGKTNEIPAARLKDHYGFSSLPKILAPYDEWTFIDRRILRFLAREAFFFKQPGHDYFTGYSDGLYSWLAEAMKKETGTTLFGKVAKELALLGQSEDVVLLSALRELYDGFLGADGAPTSFGQYVMDAIDRKLELVLGVAKERSRVRDGLIALLVNHKVEGFKKVAPTLLVIEPGRSGGTHVPHAALASACKVDPEAHEAFALKAVDATDCISCTAEVGRILLECYGDKHRQRVFSIVKATLEALSERHNKEDRYRFAWTEARYDDGSPHYIAWVLKHFGPEAKGMVFAYVENTKAVDLDVLEVVAKALGQDAVDILGEGLNMDIEDDDIASHFRRVFTMLAPLDYTKYEAKVWEIAQVSWKKVRETACLALSKLAPARVLPKAKELLAAKKGHVREAGVLILSLLDDDDARGTLKGLLATETSDDARDLVVASLFADKMALTLSDVDARVDSARARGKLERPVVKWLDEKRLPDVHWLGGKPVSSDALRFLLHRQTRQREISPDPEARDIYPLIDRASSGDFADRLLFFVLENGGINAKNRFALALVGLLGDDRVIPRLEAAAVDARNENAARTLGLLASLPAAQSLARIIKVFRVKYPNVREAAQESFNQIADGMGLTPFELADTMLPDFGFVGGSKTIDAGKATLKAVISSERKLVLYDEAGKLLKSPPKGTGENQKKELSELSKGVLDAARQFTGSLEYYLIVQRRWKKADWEKFFLVHPLAKAFAESLVWGSYGERLEQVFRVTREGALVDADDKPVTLRNNPIGLVHPLELEEKDRARWHAVLTGSALVPPFPQMDRPVFAVPAEERVKKISYLFEKKEVPSLTFKSRAERFGWRRGSVVDSGAVSAYKKVYPHDQIEAFVGTDNLGVGGYDADSEASLKELFFVKAGSIVTGSYTYDEPRSEDDVRLFNLLEVPPIVYSETVRDLHAIVRTQDDAV